MNEFEKFIDSIIKCNGFSEENKKELKCEITDHLLMLKKEYLSKGYTEQESIELSIKDFGQNSRISAELKKVLYYNNKSSNLYMKDLIKCLVSMFLLFFLINYITVNMWINFNLHMVIVYFFVILNSFIYINIKVENKNKCIKHIIIYNIIFLIAEKTIGYSICYIRDCSLNFDFITIYIFIILVMFFTIITYFFKDVLFPQKVFIYNFNAFTIIIWSISIVLMGLYSLIPNRFYMLRKIIMYVLDGQILEVKKNIFFIFINKSILIPNIGLFMIFILIVRLIILKCKEKKCSNYSRM